MGLQAAAMYRVAAMPEAQVLARRTALKVSQ
jgi:hypothetical protein